MTAALRETLSKLDNPGAQLRVRPHWRDTPQRLQRATERMHKADLARLRAAELDAPYTMRLAAVDWYIRRCHIRNAYFERACAEAGIGGNDGGV